MQEIIKSYYASGGKTLFENQTLLEYNRATTISKWGDRIILAAYANGGTNNSDGWFSMKNNRFGPWMEVLTRGAPESEYPEYQRQRQEFLTDFLTELEKMDPTDNKQYVMWLVRAYTQSIKADARHQADFERENPDQAEMAGHWSQWDLDLISDEEEEEYMDNVGNYDGNQWSIEDPIDLDSFRIEDINQINQALVDFHRIKPQLPVEQRDINRFKTFGRLQDFVDEAMGGKDIVNPETDNKTLKRSDVEVIYNGPLGTVAIPKSFQASCELGSGTRWCTTGTDDEYYRQYSEQGDLIIYNEKPGNQKYQIHPTFDQIEIRDARDVTVTADKYAEFTQSHPVLSKLIKQKQLKAFTDEADTDPGWEDNYGHPRMDSAHALVPKLISLNKRYQSGVMTYVETYYTQHFFSKNRAPGLYSGENGRTRPIGGTALDLLVTYAEQRGKPWPEIEKLVVEYIQQRYADLPDDSSMELLIMIKQFKRLKNPWPELDAIQAQLEGKGISNTPDDMNVESLDLSDIRSDYDVIELSEQVFRRSGRMYFTTRHADEQRVNRGITDSKMETAISMLEQDLDWLIYMGMNDYQMGDALSIFDPKSNITMVVVYKRPPLDPVTKEPTEVNPDKPQAINIATVYHGSPITSTKIPKILKRNNFRMKSGGQQKLTTRSPNQKEFWHLGKGIQQGGNEKAF